MSEEKDDKKGKGNQQQKQPQGPRLILMVKGTRNKCTLAVHAQKGSTPLAGKRVEFYFGLDPEDPLPVCQYNNGGQPVFVTTNAHGLAYLPDQDFSGLDPALTCIQAAMVGSTTKFQSLPVESGEPSYSFTKKVTRLKVLPTESEIESHTGFFRLTIQTFDENGNAESSQVSIGMDEEFKVFDGVTGDELNPSAVSIPVGGRILKIDPDGFSVTCSISRTAPAATVEKTLQYVY